MNHPIIFSFNIFYILSRKTVLQRIEWVSKQTLAKEEFPKVIGPLNTHPKTVEEATKPYEFFKILPKKILR